MSNSSSMPTMWGWCTFLRMAISVSIMSSLPAHSALLMIFTAYFLLLSRLMASYNCE